MDIPAFLSSGDVHLPLGVGQTSTEVIPQVNQFYQLELNPGDFKVTQVFVDGNGRYALDLILATGEGDVLIHLVNQVMAPLVEAAVETAKVNLFMGDPLRIKTAEELTFLDEIPVGWSAPTQYPTELPRTLSVLLTDYNFLASWGSGTLAPLTTAGFTLIYKGDSVNAPEGYTVPISELVAIIRINYGKLQGELCLYL